MQVPKKECSVDLNFEQLSFVQSFLHQMSLKLPVVKPPENRTTVIPILPVPSYLNPQLFPSILLLSHFIAIHLQISPILNCHSVIGQMSRLSKDKCCIILLDTTPLPFRFSYLISLQYIFQKTQPLNRSLLAGDRNLLNGF